MVFDDNRQAGDYILIDAIRMAAGRSMVGNDFSNCDTTDVACITPMLKASSIEPKSVLGWPNRARQIRENIGPDMRRAPNFLLSWQNACNVICCLLNC